MYHKLLVLGPVLVRVHEYLPLNTNTNSLFGTPRCTNKVPEIQDSSTASMSTSTPALTAILACQDEILLILFTHLTLIVPLARIKN